MDYKSFLTDTWSKFSSLFNKFVKKTYVGSRADWDLLSVAEKKQYDLADFTDDTASGVPIISDAVTDGDMNPVTSNAVASLFKTVLLTDKTFTLPLGGYVSWSNFTGLPAQPQPRFAYARLSDVKINRETADCFVEIKSSKYAAHAVFTSVNEGLPLPAETQLTVSGMVYYIL